MSGNSLTGTVLVGPDGQPLLTVYSIESGLAPDAQSEQIRRSTASGATEMAFLEEPLAYTELEFDFLASELVAVG